VSDCFVEEFILSEVEGLLAKTVEGFLLHNMTK